MITLAPPERFHTEGLCLRRIREADAGAIFAAYCTDAEATRLLMWLPHRSVEDTKRFIAACDASWGRGEEFVYVMADDADAPAFGSITIRRRKAHEAGFGYVLAKDRAGQGLATEALSALAEWALSQDGMWRASAFCDVANKASARVLEKAGFRLEGRHRRFSVAPAMGPEPRDCLAYARVRDDIYGPGERGA